MSALTIQKSYQFSFQSLYFLNSHAFIYLKSKRSASRVYLYFFGEQKLHGRNNSHIRPRAQPLKARDLKVSPDAFFFVFYSLARFLNGTAFKPRSIFAIFYFLSIRVVHLEHMCIVNRNSSFHMLKL